MQQLMNEARTEHVARRVLPITAQRLLGELGFPPGARLVVQGQPVHEVEIDWIDPEVASGVMKGPLHERKMITCPVSSCAGRGINGQGPFACHLRWHEQRGDEVPSEAYDEAGIAPKDRPARRRRRT